MARQYHFVVHYDDILDEYWLDYDTQEAKFDNSPIYNTDTDQWERLTEEHFDDDNTVYNRSADALARAIQTLKPLEVKEQSS
jgi:hypothetical protein